MESRLYETEGNSQHIKSWIDSYILFTWLFDSNSTAFCLQHVDKWNRGNCLHYLLIVWLHSRMRPMRRFLCQKYSRLSIFSFRDNLCCQQRTKSHHKTTRGKYSFVCVVFTPTVLGSFHHHPVQKEVRPEDWSKSHQETNDNQYESNRVHEIPQIQGQLLLSVNLKSFMKRL